MRRGGIVGYQNNGLVGYRGADPAAGEPFSTRTLRRVSQTPLSGIADEWTYGEDPEQDSEQRLGWADVYEYDPTKSWLGTPEGDYASGERSILGDVGRFFGRLAAAPYNVAQAGTYGLASLVENILPGQQFKGHYRGPQGQLLAKRLFRDRDDPGSYYDPRTEGWSGQMRRVSGEPSADDDALSEIEDWIAAQEGTGAGAGAGAGAGRGDSVYQDLFAKIDEFAEAAAIPSESERNRYKLADDRAKDLAGRRTGIEALMPTEEEDRLRNRSVGFGALSKFLPRTGGPRDIEPGGVGAAIRGETTRQRDRRRADEGILAGIDTDIYGVESGSLGERALRERAGDAFQGPMIGALQSKIESGEAERLARLQADLALNVERVRQQGATDYFRPQNLPAILNFLNDPGAIEYISLEQRQGIVREIARRLSGGPSPDDVSEEDLMKLYERLTEGS